MSRHWTRSQWPQPRCSRCRPKRQLPVVHEYAQVPPDPFPMNVPLELLQLEVVQ